ncbi:MAG: M48 family metallopeptidase [Pseudobdellovibrio sp.]
MKDINFEIFYPRRARRITLRVKPNRTVRITAPKWIKKSELNQFLLAHHDWVQDRIQEIERHTAARSVELTNNSKITFLNQEFILKTHQGKAMFREDAGHLHLWVPEMTEAEIKKVLSKWYKGKSIPELHKSVAFYSTCLGVKAKSVRVRSYKARWGACSSKGELIFNWQIATLNERQFNYVVAHEVCHLLEMNHSSRFYNLLQSLGFDKRQVKIEMKNLRNIF